MSSTTKPPCKFLTEDEKMCRLVDRLRSMDFGTVTITKKHGKFTRIAFEGEDIFLIPEYCKDDKEVLNAPR